MSERTTSSRPRLPPLPIDEVLDALTAAVGSVRRAVLTAPPGAGKTTRVPPAMLRSIFADPQSGDVLVLQPRRVAARATAQRIADENGWTIGREVGWHIRNDNRCGRGTRLRVLTEGILTRRLESDDYLDGVGAVVLDEFHERGLHTDLALARLRELQTTVRPDLAIIVMSATMQAEPVAAFLGGCPIIRSAGRTFPVTVRHALRQDARPLMERVADAICGLLPDDPSAVQDTFFGSANGSMFGSLRLPSPVDKSADHVPPAGDVLAFLPGMGEIRAVERMITAAAVRAGAVVLPLHGSLPPAEQDRALRPDPAGRRKIVLATNVAETSLTIDGIRTVVDAGVARVLRADAERGLERLELTRISKASADQRAGRAGRTAPGTCLRLWTAEEHRLRPDAEEPDVRRVDLSAAVVSLLEWGHAAEGSFEWFEAPPAERLAGARALLERLGAVRDGRLTALGSRVRAWPLHPRLAVLMTAATAWGAAEVGAGVAAVLGDRDVLPAQGPAERQRAPSLTGSSDVLRRMEILEAFACRGGDVARTEGLPEGIDGIALRAAAEQRDDLLRTAERLARDGVPRPADLGLPGLPAGTDAGGVAGRLVLLGFPDRLARRRPAEPDDPAVRGTMAGGRGVVLAAGSMVRDAELFVCLDPHEVQARDGRRECRVRTASAVDPAWPGQLAPHLLSRESGVEWDEARQAVVPVRRLRFLDLVLEEDRHGVLDPEAAGRELARRVAMRPEVITEGNDGLAAWMARVRWLRGVMPELGLPAFEGAELEELLAPVLRGRRSLDDVRRAPVGDALRGSLEWRQRQAVDEHAPESLPVPTGNRIRLRYEAGRPPVLAVRLQELFGAAETPRVAGGRVAVLLHLLSPGHRPVQVTDDLRSFWNNVYPQVRKDLRGRYPKHAWPEDPWNEPPTARAKPRGK